MYVKRFSEKRKWRSSIPLKLMLHVFACSRFFIESSLTYDHIKFVLIKGVFPFKAYFSHAYWYMRFQYIISYENLICSIIYITIW